MPRAQLGHIDEGTWALHSTWQQQSSYRWVAMMPR